MFDPVDPKQALPKMELGILQYWKEEDIFQRSIKQRSSVQGRAWHDAKSASPEDTFSFYDGPPFATGLPHYGHLLAGTIKDVIPRYQTMCGKVVQRRFGWDCHGLPVENLIEKEHGIEGRKQIEEMGVGKFNELCCSSVQRFTKEWQEVVERMGRWVDMNWDYRTMDPDYMESIWWVFKQLYDKGLVYEGHKPMHICPRCVTPLSNFEVTQGYKEITDTSVTVKFELVDEPGTFVLAWTTTPWTLPGNLFLAVGPKIQYAKVAFEGNHYILAKSAVEKIFKGKEYKVQGNMAANTLAGKHFKPLFPYFVETYKKEKNTFRIVTADFVATDEGTGIVHIAPGFGEDDFRIGEREKVDVLQHVTMDGKFVPEVTDFAGMDVKPIDDPGKTDRKVVEWLEKHGLLFSKEPYRHSYPHCWRCDSPLLNYATSSWFVSIEKIKEKLLSNNAKTEWIPAHLRDGRFGKWLEGARDWAISRNRYWGTPLPIWRNEETGDVEVLGSRDDLMAHAPERFTKVTIVRHGESEGNLTPIYQAIEPGTNLTKQGKEQAKATAKLLAGRDQKSKIRSQVPVDIIYCSPLARTQQTAQTIAKETGAEIIVDDRLREVNFGEYEGKTVDFNDLAFVKARRAHKLQEKSPESIYHFPGMETWNDVQKRLSSFMVEMLPRHRGKHVVVVTHADVVQNAKHFFTREDPLKISHQPYPSYAEPRVFFWDHERNAQMDLHKDTVDGILWNGSGSTNGVEALFVRHGETDWNKEKKIQGKQDTLLNKTGREQARKLAKTLAKEHFDAIISSDLKRAAETADILSEELGMPVDARWDELRERSFGDWEGKKRDEIDATIPGQFAVQDMHFPNGETINAFFSRIRLAQQKLLKAYAGKRVLVVAHGGVLKAIEVLNGLKSLEKVQTSFTENTASVHVSLHPPFKRIPEVLDCWFESGAMPYAQSHFPFDHAGEELPPGFPADFIAEGVDQTRGWFYTLMVLSSALFNEPAFRHCVVNGIVLAEDGKKMSKRLKNYPEPTEIVEKYGADAIRFTLMSSPAVRGEDLRMSEKLVAESLRNVLLPLWNTYSFFVTYANAATFEPVATRKASAHPLDRWILAEVQDLVNRMTEQLDRYELSATCAELHDTIDALTNWYVRLSRRRFAGKTALEEGESASAIQQIDGAEEDRLDALRTLYDVLISLTQLLAPFCPFITDAIYLNLVPEEHVSVHLTDWPEARALRKEELALLQKTRLLRTIVSLGLSIRSEQKIKARQPLASATVAVPPALAKNAALSDEDVQLLRNELNVKHLTFTEDPGSLATAVALVDARKAGPRLGARVQEVIKAGKAGEFTQQEDGSVLVLDEVFSPDEVQIVYRGEEGRNAAANHGIVVSIETTLTEDLRLEGLARDVIRAVQRLRKEAGLEFTDTITLAIDGAEELMQTHGDLIAHETRARLGENSGGKHTVDLEGQAVTVRFEKK
ncbi:MAG: class I tRNA ligase family protein [Candidatus Peribacteraceae bacterium]|nr:class I tRNA ligase family protein [Candidatus Peribacteraceae bacterium]